VTEKVPSFMLSAAGDEDCTPDAPFPGHPAAGATEREWLDYAEKVENYLAGSEHFRRHLTERIAFLESSVLLRTVQRTKRFIFGRCLNRFPRFRHRLIRLLKVWLREGIFGVGRRLSDRSVGDPAYEAWLERHGSTAAELTRLKATVSALPQNRRPLISVLTPVFNPQARWLEEAIASVRTQIWPAWELVLVDDASTAPHVREILSRAAAEDVRIRPIFREVNGNISRATQDALAAAQGEFMALLDHDDTLTPDALARVALLLNETPDTDMIFSDEDKLELNGRLTAPYFKPAWAPEMFLGTMYTCHLGVYRTALAKAVGGFREGYEGAQDYDFVLRLAEKTNRIRHLPRVLYHWRRVPGSTARRYSEKSYAEAAAAKALNDAIARRNWSAIVEPGPIPSLFRIRRKLFDRPLVSIIIPFRDKPELLERCVTSIRARTNLADIRLELILADNGSRAPAAAALLRDYAARPDVKILRDDGPFNFSRLNNRAAREASAGEYLLFLNNDTEALNDEWLSALVEHGQNPEVGAVGAKLLYPDGRVQHAGVVLGVGEVAGHAHRLIPDHDPGYFGGAAVVREFSAVTGACLLTRRALFLEMDGFDEVNLAVAYNDVDYCLRLRERGLRVLYTPYARLRHHESASRGLVNNPREAAYMQRRWGKALLNDPYYHPALSRLGEHFTLGL
jgi:GT2 family glycosyltransferase